MSHSLGRCMSEFSWRSKHEVDVLELAMNATACMGPKVARGCEAWGCTSARPLAALMVYGYRLVMTLISSRLLL